MIQLINVGERGIIVSLSKEDLQQILHGKSLSGELVGPNGKVPLIFMRDRTFRSVKHKFDTTIHTVVEGAGIVKDTLDEAGSLGAELGSNSAEQPQQ